MWRKDAPFNIEKISIMKDYIVLSVKIGSLILVLVNVYLRSDIWEIRTLDAYLDGLSSFLLILIPYILLGILMLTLLLGELGVIYVILWTEIIYIVLIRKF